MLKHRFTGFGGSRNFKGITSSTKYPMQIHLDKFLLKEGPGLVMNHIGISHHLWRKSHCYCFSYRSGERESPLLFFFFFFSKRIVNYPLHTLAISPTPSKISPLRCIFHIATRVVFLKDSLETLLPSGYKV